MLLNQHLSNKNFSQPRVTLRSKKICLTSMFNIVDNSINLVKTMFNYDFNYFCGQEDSLQKVEPLLLDGHHP
jgi:hypothetical protein